jgi:hypothetical protein
MADYTNRQLAQIIAQSAEKINNSVIKEQKIAGELEKIVSKLQNEKNVLQELDKKIESLKRVSIKPDLSGLNSFYESKTEENVKQLNSRLKVPNLSLYVWLSSLAFVIIGFLSLYLAYSKAFTTREEIVEKYRADLLKENSIIPSQDHQLFRDMDQFFRKNPKTKDKFVQWRQGVK